MQESFSRRPQHIIDPADPTTCACARYSCLTLLGRGAKEERARSGKAPLKQPFLLPRRGALQFHKPPLPLRLSNSPTLPAGTAWIALPVMSP